VQSGGDNKQRDSGPIGEAQPVLAKAQQRATLKVEGGGQESSSHERGVQQHSLTLRHSDSSQYDRDDTQAQYD